MEPDGPVTEFGAAVHRVVRSVPPGEIATYGEVAEEAGRPGAARAVGTVLAASDGLPWWRIVNAQGRLAPGKEVTQATHLRAEGVEITERTSGWFVHRH